MIRGINSRDSTAQARCLDVPSSLGIRGVVVTFALIKGKMLDALS